MATKATKKEKNAVVKNTPKKGSKSVTSEKGEVVTKNKPNIFKTIWNFVMKHKIIFGIFLIIILIIIFTLLFLKLSLNFTAITINDDKYSKADMNMSLYNLKYNYFGKDASEIPDATLEEQLSSVGMTVSEYLKSETVNELKYRSVIKKIADDNNITLTEEEKEEINSNIKSVINSFGSHGKFKKFLSKNKITEKAYKSYLESDKLYDKVFEELYASGKKNYLTDEEIKKETNTLESLTDTVINQKKTLIETILEKAKSGVDFEELVKKYSEEASSDNNLYFTKDDVLEEVYNAVDSLKEDEISEIIKTKYAYSIIKRLKLDDRKLDEYLEKKAKIKFNNDITTKAEDYKVFYENAYKKIK